MKTNLYKSHQWMRKGPQDNPPIDVEFDLAIVPSVGDTISFDNDSTDYEVAARHFRVDPETDEQTALVRLQ